MRTGREGAGVVRIVAGAEFGVVIQRRNRAQRSSRVVESVGSGNGARVTKMVEVNEVDRRVGVAEGAGSGGRNGGQTPVAGSILLRQGYKGAGQQRAQALYCSGRMLNLCYDPASSLRKRNDVQGKGWLDFNSP